MTNIDFLGKVVYKKDSCDEVAILVGIFGNQIAIGGMYVTDMDNFNKYWSFWDSDAQNNWEIFCDLQSNTLSYKIEDNND